MLLTTTLLGLSSWHTPPDSVPKRVSVFPLPVVYYTPETRLAFGAAATATLRFRRDAGDSTARPSQLTFGVAYTQNRQLLVYLPFQLFYDHNRYYAYGEAGYYRYSYYFFGVGERAVSKELYGVNFPRIRVNAFRRIVPSWQRGKLYAGLRYQYEDYDVTHVVPDGELASGQVPGGRGSRLTGGGLGLFFDARDRVFFPTRGVVADVAYLHRNRAAGAGAAGKTTRFSRLSADVSSYHRLTPRTILALNYFVSYTAGTAPFNALSLLGGTKRLRGYYEGRYRDQNAAVLQSELRLPVYKRLGAVVFGGVGVLGNEREVLRLDAPKAAYGAGLRFTVNRRDHLNLRLDYGWGRQSSGLYITIGEAF
ncbi:BamA/TamA family outer membrane protein [Hymenobacter busanensis]|uniref:BamA/TamA family outer membrane protein n=1 Tax=Hymenobacter busanensis TaxID=2607656 RepID=A0A7L4ZSA1_9BACT|nr:BamA/TamA family outer membrane protein [Hymenobacter busanensis]KAA9327267.1 BamA/TamA family outer membrane protein [Hymenobacter busanensis]QHJ05931.1 BamA/TamA family outer membrane protein [Hymenobacter busanensis]